MFAHVRPFVQCMNPVGILIMASWHGNPFRITCPMGGTTGRRLVPSTKGQDFSALISSLVLTLTHDDGIKWEHFLPYWPFVRGINWSPVNSPHKDHWRAALIFSLVCASRNGCINNGDAGDLRRHRAHYDVIVMNLWISIRVVILDAIMLMSRDSIVLLIYLSICWDFVW